MEADSKKYSSYLFVETEAVQLKLIITEPNGEMQAVPLAYNPDAFEDGDFDGK